MSRPRSWASARHRLGFSYLEVLVAAVVLALALVPALEGLRTGLQAAEVGETRAAAHYHAVAKLEEVLAQPFSDLEAAVAGSGTPSAAYSDPAGAPDRRLVYLAGYDADDADGDGNHFTGTDAGILWVRVQIESSAWALDALSAE